MNYTGVENSFQIRRHLRKRAGMLRNHVTSGGKDGLTEMDLMQSSEEWSRTHFTVNDLLSQLLNELRDLGYNPSYHVSYDQNEHHILVDPDILKQHPKLSDLFQTYVEACTKRDEAVEKIQSLPKIDLGF